MLGYGAARGQGRRRCGVRVSGRLTRAVCSAWRSSLWGRCGSRGPRRGRRGRVRARALALANGGSVSSCGLVVHCSSCCAAAARVPPVPRTRARRARMQRGSSARSHGTRALETGRSGGGPLDAKIGARLSASRIHVRGSASVDRHSTTPKTSPIDPVHTRASTQTCSTVRQIISPIQASAVIPPQQWVPCSGPKRGAHCSPCTPSPRAGTALTGSVQRIVPTTPVTSARRDPVARPAASPASSRSGLRYVMGPPT